MTAWSRCSRLLICDVANTPTRNDRYSSLIPCSRSIPLESHSRIAGLSIPSTLRSSMLWTADCRLLHQCWGSHSRRGQCFTKRTGWAPLLSQSSASSSICLVLPASAFTLPLSSSILPVFSAPLFLAAFFSFPLRAYCWAISLCFLGFSSFPPSVTPLSWHIETAWSPLFSQVTAE